MIKESKICSRCGRAFSNRKKWKNNFEKVKYCSEKCRRTKFKCWKNEIINYLKNTRKNSFLLSEFLDKQLATDHEAIKISLRFLAQDGIVRILQSGKEMEVEDIKYNLAVVKTSNLSTL